MNNLTKITHLMDRIVGIVAPALVFTAVLAYGSLIFCGRMRGDSINDYKIAHVYTFDRIIFSFGGDTLRVENGNLGTAVRGGEENYVAIEGDILFQWRLSRRIFPPPQQSYHMMRLSLHASELRRVMEDNRGALRELLEGEPHAAMIKKKIKMLLDWPPPSDLLQAIFSPFRLKFYKPPRQGIVELQFLDSRRYDMVGTTLRTRPYDSYDWAGEMAERQSARIWHYATIVPLRLFLVSAFLAVVLVAAGGLSTVAHMAHWIGSLIRGESRFMASPIRNLLFILVVLLYAGALISILLSV